MGRKKQTDSFTVNKQELSKFFELIYGRGESQISFTTLKINKDNISALVAQIPTKSILVRASLVALCQEHEEIGIDELGNFVKFLNLFESEQVNITIKNNKITLSSQENSRLKVSRVLINPQALFPKENRLTEELFNHFYEKLLENLFDFSRENTEKLIKYASIVGLKSLEEKNNLMLIGKDGNFTVEIESSTDNLVDDFEVEPPNDFKVKITGVLLDILGVIDDDVKLSISNDGIVLIKYKKDNIEVDYIVKTLV